MIIWLPGWTNLKVLPYFWISHLVERACLFRDVILIHPFESQQRISTVAAMLIPILGTWKQDLRGKVDIWKGTLSCDLDPVRQWRGCGMGPARPTKPWNVLITGLGQEISCPEIWFFLLKSNALFLRQMIQKFATTFHMRPSPFPSQTHREC